MQVGTHDRSRWRAVWLFGAASLITIGLGSLVMAQADIPPTIWLRNTAAWIITAGLGIFLALRGWLSFSVAPVGLALITLSLIGPGQEGVHRWLDLGAVQLNAAALILPLAIASFPHERAIIAAPCFVLIAALLAWQPDISQLAGFSLAAIILGATRFGMKGALVALAVAAAAIALCLSRPDPLDPVPHVEGILLLAAGQSLPVAIAMAVTLAATVLSPLILVRTPALRWPAAALAAYFATTALAPLFGAYPVPLAGYGLSFVIGWTLGMAGLLSRRRV